MSVNRAAKRAPAEGAADVLAERIRTGTARCGVVGLGYVGLPLAVELARVLPPVAGVDVSADVVAGLRGGRSHVRDVADAAVAALVEAGSLTADSDAGTLRDCDAIVICVPTPLSKTRDPDVGHVVAAADAVAAVLRPGQLVVLESTTYPGTTRELLLPRLEAGGLRVGRDFFLCFSPERIDPGNAEWRLADTPKVMGGITGRCLELGMMLYGKFIRQIVAVSSTEAAEMTKLLENTFRAVNIALVNEMAQIADHLDVDVFEVIDAAATKPFGFMKFMPGPGIGGHCLPVDPHYLAWKLKSLNYRTRLIELASELNSEMPYFVLEKVAALLNRTGKPLMGSRILLLGVAYKRDVDDIRESPALDLLRLLEAKGAAVRYHDPHVPEMALDSAVRTSVDLLDDELAATDLIVITTDHTAVDYPRLAQSNVPIIDTRNAMHGLAGARIVGLSGRRRGDPGGRPGREGQEGGARTADHGAGRDE